MVARTFNPHTGRGHQICDSSMTSPSPARAIVRPSQSNKQKKPSKRFSRQMVIEKDTFILLKDMLIIFKCVCVCACTCVDMCT